MVRNGFRDWLLGLVGVLVVAGILGGVKVAADQSVIDQKVHTNTTELENRRERVYSIDVVQVEITNIKDDIREILTLLRGQRGN